MFNNCSDFENIVKDVNFIYNEVQKYVSIEKTTISINKQMQIVTLKHMLVE